MELKLINNDGQAAASVNASDIAFGREFNEDLVHQVIIAYMANARMATRAQKGRSEVAKSTRKPFRQKGTGNARAGMASSPLWRGGGKTFPNGPDENFSHKVNKKMHRAGMQAILSELARLGRLQVVDEFKIDSPKTKQMAQKIKSLGFDSVMVVTDSVDENLYLSSRNLPHVLIVEAQHADPVNLVRFPNVLMTRAAVKKFEEMLG
ncbi:MAG: 50S ribosomal protein L4 [Sulfuricella sp.]|jgi:large subunit ribosomal protein L4|nr:50S ribosomal protein L4 [Sulfuricella sp.]